QLEPAPCFFRTAAALCWLWLRGGCLARGQGLGKLPELPFQHGGKAGPVFCAFWFLPGDFAVSPAHHRSRSRSALVFSRSSLALLRCSLSAWPHRCLS